MAYGGIGALAGIFHKVITRTLVFPISTLAVYRAVCSLNEDNLTVPQAVGFFMC
jgi:hypothetical protein